MCVQPIKGKWYTAQYVESHVIIWCHLNCNRSPFYFHLLITCVCTDKLIMGYQHHSRQIKNWIYKRGWMWFWCLSVPRIPIASAEVVMNLQCTIPKLLKKGCLHNICKHSNLNIKFTLGIANKKTVLFSSYMNNVTVFQKSAYFSNGMSLFWYCKPWILKIYRFV